MKRLVIAAVLGLTAAAFASTPTAQDKYRAALAPKPAATAPAPAPAPKEAAPSDLPPGCVERLRAHAEKMKKELGLSETQAAAMREELQRFTGQLMAARDGHRAAVEKILTKEQNAKLEGHHAERREKMMDRCAAGDDDGDDEHHDEGKHKGQHKH